MKRFIVGLSIIFLIAACNTTNRKSSAGQVTESGTEYDSLLASELGADHYGMKQYVMALLLRGDNSSADSTEAANLQKAHLDNITRMAEEGRLVLAGPFLDSGDIRGIYIFNVSSVEEAEKLTSTDPAVKAGVLKMELHLWYGSAALQMLNDLHARIQAGNI